MSMRRILKLAATALILCAIILGCSFGVTIQGRIDQFIADLNASSRDQLYLNLDPSLADYEALKDPAYWDGIFPPVGVDTNYFVMNQTVDDPGTGIATVTADIDGPAGFSGPKLVVIGLVKVGIDWMIGSITLAGDSVVPKP